MDNMAETETRSRLVPDAKIPREELTRRRILESAKELFIRDGVENVNIHQIVKNAGVGQASVYRRYADKGDICLDIVREASGPLFADVQAYLEQSPEVPPLERLYAVITQFVQYLAQEYSWLCSVSRASSGYRPLQSPLYQSLRITCTGLLEEAAERQEITDVDVPFTVESLLAAVNHLDFHVLDHGFSMERILQGLRRIFIDGLKK
jgi:AcrR family transcriptional regulator